MNDMKYTVTLDPNNSKRPFMPREPVMWCVEHFGSIGPHWDWYYISDYKNGDKIKFVFQNENEFTHFTLAWR